MESKLKLSEIASLIMNIILGFYYHSEYFSVFLEDIFNVSPDGLTITSMQDLSCNHHAIYLNQWIKSTSKSIVKWTFKIDTMMPSTDLFFGITSTEKKPDEDVATADMTSISAASPSTLLCG